MKVLHIIPTLSKGGAEKVVVDLLNDSFENGLEVKLLLFFPSDKKLRLYELNKKIEVLYISDKKSNFFFLLFKSVIWIIQNWKFLKQQNILHAHLTISSIFISIVRLFSFISYTNPPKLVETNHSIGIPIKKWQHALFVYMSRFRDSYVLIGKDAFWEALIKKRKNILLGIIPNGIKIKNRIVEKREKQDFLMMSGIDDTNSFILGTVSRIVPERSPLKMVEIFNKVHLKLPEDKKVHFIFGGDGESFNQVQEKIAELKMENFIHLPGLIVDATVARSVMSVYLSINIGAVTGISGIEAASEGKPVISLQMDNEYVNSQNDWIWSDCNTDKISDEIIKLISDEKLRFEIAQFQYNYVKQNLQSNLMAKEYENLYLKVLK